MTATIAVLGLGEAGGAFDVLGHAELAQHLGRRGHLRCAAHRVPTADRGDGRVVAPYEGACGGQVARAGAARDHLARL